MNWQRLLKVFIDDYSMEWRRNSANHCAIGRTLPSQLSRLLYYRRDMEERLNTKWVSMLHLPPPLGFGQIPVPSVHVSSELHWSGSACLFCPSLWAWTSNPCHLHTHPQSENPSTSLSQFLHFLFHKELKIPNVHKPHIIFTRTPQVSFKSTSSESRFLL